MIVSIYLKEHQYLINEPQTFNFGGKYLYSFLPLKGDNLIVRRTPNKKYISDFFDIARSECKLDLLSAIVGQNGVGKSTVMDVIRSAFVNSNALPFNRSTILVEIDGETKVLSSSCSVFIVDDENGDDQVPDVNKKSESIKSTDYQTIYYSPHFDLKYNPNFDPTDEYDISLDQFIKQDLESTDKKGPDG